MRKINSRSFMILLMTLAFFAGLTYHTVNLVLHASQWVAEPTNSHLTDVDGLEFAGKIFDRNGVVLAQSIDKQRVYNDDEEIRRACLHIVGDNSVNIATAVQTVYRSELTKYNFTFGLGLPDILKKGNNMTLTIDTRLQRAALRALGDYKGAMLFYNYKTGEILCMVSTPTYDPQDVPEDIETNELYDGAYLNRALSASYPPGSTFKLVTAAAALKEVPGIENSTYDCHGADYVGDKQVTCYEANGIVDIKEALAQSCNIFFAKLAVALGKDKMTSYAEQMGFNSRWSFDGITTSSSRYDVTQADENELGWSGVGQYTVLETPVNMAIISAAIANGGTPVMPYFISTIDGKQKNKTTLGNRMMEKDIADKLYEMMDYTVYSNYGKSYVSEKLDVCAKTGTAEVSSDGLAHAWVTGFCKDEDCPIAFAAVVEYGNYAYSVAIPMVRQVLDTAADIYKKY